MQTTHLKIAYQCQELGVILPEIFYVNLNLYAYTFIHNLYHAHFLHFLKKRSIVYVFFLNWEAYLNSL